MSDFGVVVICVVFECVNVFVECIDEIVFGCVLLVG